MQNTVFVKSYEEPEFNMKEILRYAGEKEPNAQTKKLILECLDEVRGKLLYKVCYIELAISRQGDVLDLTFAKTHSLDLKKNLCTCDSIILFAATIGIEIDRLISRYSRISPAKALIFQAIGAERIENLADSFNDEIKNILKKQGKFAVPRFSAGYGDFPLEFQKDIFLALDCPRKIGLSLNESLIMSPSKSVTAIIGISNINTSNKSRSCSSCTKTNCDFRR